MKVRIGVGLGAAGVPSHFDAAVDSLEAAGVDSLWLPEMVYGPLVDPFIGMTWALARTSPLKVGTGIAVLPGRHPVLVAKQLASWPGWRPGGCSRCSGSSRPGRVSWPPSRSRPAAGPRSSTSPCTSSGGCCGGGGDLPRRVLLGRGAADRPAPARPLDIWLGGSAPGALRRVGRLGDGWLASFLTPAEAGDGRQVIEEAAAEAGREIEPDHFGISLALATGPELQPLYAAARQRRPDADPAAFVANGWADARRKIEEYVAAGLTKFVVRPGGGRRRPGAVRRRVHPRDDAAAELTGPAHPAAGVAHPGSRWQPCSLHGEQHPTGPRSKVRKDAAG